jgi:hypothetical protein
MTEDLAKAEPPLESEHKNALDTARKIVAYASVFSDLFKVVMNLIPYLDVAK